MTVIYHTEKQLAQAIEQATRRRFVLGVDLGTAQDYTALAALEVVEVPDLKLGCPVPQNVPYTTRYELRHVERLRLHQSYVDVVAHMEMSRSMLQIGGGRCSS
jgi:hypothetical protein